MKRVMLYMLALLLILSAGCGRKTEGTDESDGETGILTGVFRETARYALGSGGELYNPLTGGVYRDPDSGALTVFEVQTMLYENTGRATLDVRLRTISPEGETLSTVEFPREEAVGYLYCCGAYVTAEQVYWLNCLPSDGVRKVTLHAADPDGGNQRTVPMDGALSASALEALTAHLDFHLAAAPDGTVWISAGEEIVCLSPSLEKSYSITAPNPVTDLGLTPEGILIFGCSDETDPYNTALIYKVDMDSRRYTMIRDIAGEADFGRIGVTLFFGPGYEYYYEENRWERTPGIVGVKDGADTLVLNRNNSGVEEKWTSLLSVVDPELVLYQQISETGAVNLIAYGHAPDIDLSQVPTIEIACANWFSFSDLEKKAARYNRAHPEIHVTVTRCVDQKTYYEDTDRLIFDLGNGFYKPDIILGQCGGPVLTTVLQKNLWTDLSPRLDGDPLVNRDNLFDSVEKLFSTKDGKLWGLTPEFTVSTMIGRRDVLGKYAEKGSWTLNEFIDFARSLPEGTLLSPYITKRYFGPMLGTAGFDHWIDYDAAACRFEDEDFLAFLSFFRDLPDGPDDIMKKYPFGEAVVSGADFMQEYQYYRSGQVALRTNGVQSIENLLFEFDLQFGTAGTDDLVYMGCPTSAEDGLPANDLTADNTYVITSYCADPDSAWDVLRSFFDVADEYSYLSQIRFPALISEFDELAEGWMSHWYFMSPDRKKNRVEEKGEGEIDRAALGIPEDYMAVTMTDEDYRRIRAFLDSEAGTPAVDYTPDGITDIILEEIDVMLGKGSSEADCAKMIQSRVSIWLAENR